MFNDIEDMKKKYMDNFQNFLSDENKNDLIDKKLI